MNVETLMSIGLTKGESDVYLTLLKLGNTSSGKIIKNSKVSRSKVYDVLERLKQKGLATEVTKENVKYFEATDPKRIIDYLTTKKNDIIEKITQSKKIVQDLDKLKSLQLEQQEAKVYAGLPGLRTAYNEILDELKEGEEYYAFGMGPEEIKTKELNLFFKNFHMRRADKKITAKILMQPGTKKEMSSFSKLKYYKYRYTNTKVPTNIGIWGKSVLTLVWGDNPVAFVIKSKQVADKYKAYFDDVWQNSKS